MTERLGPEAALALPGLGFLLGVSVMAARNWLAAIKERETRQKRFDALEIGLAVLRSPLRRRRLRGAA